ncbi:MAG: Fmu (Sun) domain-containing protein [Chitinophagaceae bacterium]
MDRRLISHLSYCYFRLGKAEINMPLEERILAGLFFCSNEPNEMLDSFKPEWNKNVSLPLPAKCAMLNINYSTLDVFPWEEELSEGIEYEAFSESFFIQPDLFLRLRPGKESVVKQKLEEKQIGYKIIKDNCIVLSNSSKLEEVIRLNKEAVVQDYNSQRVSDFLVNLKTQTRRCEERSKNLRFSVWDCCAASGGKSIMAMDVLGDIDLTVSDIRESILVNLKKRFNDAGIKKYNSFVADLTTAGFSLKSSNFELIICDAPCTGSGTWSRTPEQLYYFDKKEIGRYASLQQQIVSTTIPYLEAGGYILYITCSVFKRENEEIIEFIKENFHLNLMKMEVLKGYDKKADTMFAALLQKPL